MWDVVLGLLFSIQSGCSPGRCGGEGREEGNISIHSVIHNDFC